MVSDQRTLMDMLRDNLSSPGHILIHELSRYRAESGSPLACHELDLFRLDLFHALGPILA